MKKILPIIMFIVTIVANAQVNEEKKELFTTRITQLFESFEVNDISSIKIYLSEDLKVSGHDGNTALNILQSIPLQIPAPKEYEIISVVQENDNYRVKVAITLPEKDECDFLFDSKGQFVEINMIEVHVQEHSNSEKIELAEPLRIPFELKDDLIFIKVNIKGQSDTLNFVFDTGATSTVLDSTMAIKFGIKSLSTQSQTGATGSQVYHLSNIDTLKIGGLDLTNVECVLVNLEHLRGKGKGKIDGIIGYAMLRDYVTKIDYNNSELVFYNDIRESNEIYKNQLKFDFENGPIPQINISMRLKTGERFTGKVFMDTGARPNFILNSNITKDNGLLEKFNPKIDRSTKSLTAISKEYVSTVDQLSLNEDFFSNDVPIIISLATEGVSSFPNLLGILGNGILKKRNWIFDYENQIAFYEKNQFTKKKFEYPCTNFSIQLENGMMSFIDVQPNSEEAQKGIQTDMEILSVNGYKMDDYDIIKKFLKTPNIKLEICYKNKLGKKKRIEIKTSRKI